MMALVAMSARPAIMFAYSWTSNTNSSQYKYVEDILPPNLHSMSGLCLGCACNANQTQYALAGFAGNERLRLGRQRSAVLHLDWLLCAQSRLHAVAHGPA